MWNETRIPEEGCCGKCAVKWDSGGRFATPYWLRQLFAREKNENNNKKKKKIVDGSDHLEGTYTASVTQED